MPHTLADIQRQWNLTLGRPFEGGTCSWVAPVVRGATRAILKIGMPHMEAEHEWQGLQFWSGDPTIRFLDVDADRHAMLLESCAPGVSLSTRPEDEQDVVIASRLRRLWRRPVSPHPFRHLATMVEFWAAETLADAERWTDTALVETGLQLFKELSRPSVNDVLLATDLHAGNVLSAEREPWLVIDPKPFIGDRAYDATQHLLNCQGRLRDAPDDTIRRVSALAGLDAERVRLWLFARIAAEPRDKWSEDSLRLARDLHR